MIVITYLSMLTIRMGSVGADEVAGGFNRALSTRQFSR